MSLISDRYYEVLTSDIEYAFNKANETAGLTAYIWLTRAVVYALLSISCAVQKVKP